MKMKKKEGKKKILRRPRLLRERGREAVNCEEARPVGKLIKTTALKAGWPDAAFSVSDLVHLVDPPSTDDECTTLAWAVTFGIPLRRHAVGSRQWRTTRRARQSSTRIVWAIVNEELQTLHVVAILVQLGLEYIERLVYRANVLGGGPLGRLSAGVP